MNNSKKIFIILFCVVLLPALFYSFYQISSLSETEELIGTVYTRQMDAILFSVNQYVLDVASSWATQIEETSPKNDFSALLASNKSIRTIIVSDSTLNDISPRSHSQRQLQRTTEMFKIHREKIERLFRYRSTAYRKLEPVIANDSSVMILFVPAHGTRRVIGIVLNTTQFINDIVAKKLSDLASGDFTLAVVQNATKQISFSTGTITPKKISQQRQLWIFPEYSLGIGLQGETLEEIARGRFYRNLSLIIVLDIVLLAGALFVYRTIKQEMHLVALKSDFVSNVSHELRTPLALIRMFAETLEMKRVKTEKKKQEYYGIILHETERLTRLINNILNFSRMESNTRRYNFKQTDVNAVISEVLSIYSYQLEHLKFTVSTSLEKNLPHISADEEAIAEALHNLIDNAIKYSADKKFLRIATSHSQNSMIIDVEDRGIGIAAEHQSKIFEKFYRVSLGLVHTAKGSGLGLAIVRHIVQSHGGTITITSEPGNGSRFTITLPLT